MTLQLEKKNINLVWPCTRDRYITDTLACRIDHFKKTSEVRRWDICKQRWNDYKNNHMNWNNNCVTLYSVHCRIYQRQFLCIVEPQRFCSTREVLQIAYPKLGQSMTILRLINRPVLKGGFAHNSFKVFHNSSAAKWTRREL